MVFLILLLIVPELDFLQYVFDINSIAWSYFSTIMKMIGKIG